MGQISPEQSPDRSSGRRNGEREQTEGLFVLLEVSTDFFLSKVRSHYAVPSPWDPFNGCAEAYFLLQSIFC